MNGQASGRPWYISVVGVLAALWNGVGAFDYSMTETRNARYMTGFTADELAYFYDFPGWAVGAWALGVWGGLAGALLLLLRSRWAVHAFVLSLLGVAGMTAYQMTHAVPASFRTTASLGLTAAIWTIAGLLLWYAVAMRERGVLR